METRMNEEANAHKLFITQAFPSASSFDIASVRSRNERLHSVINKQLSALFAGCARDDVVPTDNGGEIIF